MKKHVVIVLFLLATLAGFTQAQCPTPPPPTVNGVSPCTPTIVALSPYEVKFNVDPIVTGQTGFYAERSIDPDPFIVINAGYPNGNFRDCFEIEPGGVFCYRTRAYNSCGGKSSETNVAMVTMPTGTEPYKNAPDAPTSLSATAQSGPKVLLSWTGGAFPGLASINATSPGLTSQGQGFQIQRSLNGITWGTVNAKAIVPSSTTTAVTYTDSSVSSGTPYYYRVRSFNQFGWATGFEGNCGPTLTTCGTAYTNVVTVTP
jgi:hypothetical protein